MLLLPFGRHQLSLRCAACAPAEKEEDIDVSGGEHKEIELALAPAPPSGATASGDGAGAGAGAGTGAAGATITQPGGDRDTSADRGHAHLWLAGLAGAAAVGAGGAALLWHTESKELKTCEAIDPSTQTCTAHDDIDGRRKLAIGLTIGLGAVAVGSAVFAAILWSHPDKPESGSSSNVACAIGTIGKGSVSCAFRF
jgi:hypothetical protein